MRKLIAAALLFLLPAAALAQDAAPIETIESDRLDTLTGIWEIAFPSVTWEASVPLMARAGSLIPLAIRFAG